MTKRASWFGIEILDSFVGTETFLGRTWGMARIRLDYDRGGWTIADAPIWLLGFFFMERPIQGKTRIGTTAGVLWNRYWRLGQKQGWVRLIEVVTAEDLLKMELGDASGFAEELKRRTR